MHTGPGSGSGVDSDPRHLVLKEPEVNQADENKSQTKVPDDKVPNTTELADMDLESAIPFSTRRPKDILTGTTSGVKNLFKGIGLGITTLIAAPIFGAREGGGLGFLKGVAVGLLGSIVMPIAGVVTGFIQITRGVINTPQAVIEGYQGNKVWDKTTRNWVSYNLYEDWEIMQKITEKEYFQKLKETKKGVKTSDKSEPLTGQTTSSNTTKSAEINKKPKNTANVKDMEYYNLLGVDSDASPGQIKKGYYLMARLLHPDKNKNDPNANERFQKVGAAYQVLSDPGLRSKYDQLGLDGVEDVPVMDSTAFYTLIFGSDKFDFYVGELKLAMMMMAGAEQSENELLDVIGNPTIEFKQARREVKVAYNLAKFLEDFVAEYKVVVGSKIGAIEREKQNLTIKCPNFEAKVSTEARELGSNAMGAAMLSILGYAYVEHSKNYLGFQHSLSAGFGFVELKRRGHSLANKYRLVSSAFDGYRTAKKQGMFEVGDKMAEDKGGKSKDSKVKESNESEEKQGGKTGEKKAQLSEEEKAMQGFIVMVDTLWRITVIDVESTVRKGLAKLFFDSSVPLEDRIIRAKGIYQMGRIFRDAGKNSDEGLLEIKSKLKQDLENRKAFAQSTEEWNGNDTSPSNDTPTAS